MLQKYFFFLLQQYYDPAWFKSGNRLSSFIHYITKRFSVRLIEYERLLEVLHLSLNCLQTISGYVLCIFFKDFTLVSQTKKNITNVQINVENAK